MSMKIKQGARDALCRIERKPQFSVCTILVSVMINKVESLWICRTARACALMVVCPHHGQLIALTVWHLRVPDRPSLVPHDPFSPFALPSSQLLTWHWHQAGQAWWDETSCPQYPVSQKGEVSCGQLTPGRAGAITTHCPTTKQPKNCSKISWMFPSLRSVLSHLVKGTQPEGEGSITDMFFFLSSIRGVAYKSTLSPRKGFLQNFDFKTVLCKQLQEALSCSLLFFSRVNFSVSLKNSKPACIFYSIRQGT